MIDFKYDCGDFLFTSYGSSIRMSGHLKDFFDSMAYYVCDYIENEETLIPREKLPVNIHQFFIDTLLECANKLEYDTDFIHKSPDFIIFVSEHDMSNNEKLELISKTVDKDLFDKLLGQ